MLNFNKLFLEYKTYIESNSQYNAKVVRDYNYEKTEKSKFPIIDISYNDSVNTSNSTVDGIEYYDREYFIITIYAIDKGTISKNVITDELKYLTQKFMGKYKGMERTSCKPVPNLDKTMVRTIMKYTCLKGNVYNNIIRRTL